MRAAMNLTRDDVERALTADWQTTTAVCLRVTGYDSIRLGPLREPERRAQRSLIHATYRLLVDLHGLGKVQMRRAGRRRVEWRAA